MRHDERHRQQNADLLGNGDQVLSDDRRDEELPPGDFTGQAQIGQYLVQAFAQVLEPLKLPSCRGQVAFVRAGAELGKTALLDRNRQKDTCDAIGGAPGARYASAAWIRTSRSRSCFGGEAAASSGCRCEALFQGFAAFWRRG